jgi:hypothetical protein
MVENVAAPTLVRDVIRSKDLADAKTSGAGEVSVGACSGPFVPLGGTGNLDFDP